MKYILTTALIYFLLSCNSSSKKEAEHNTSQKSVSEIKEKPLSDQLVGTWSNLNLRVVSNRTSENKKEWEVIAECHLDNWEEQMKIKPIVTEYTTGGEWSSEHRDLNDKIFYVPKGNWWIEGDSLYMQESEPDSSNFYSYLLEFEDGNAKFSGYLDWDEDGAKDDLYVGIQKRVGSQ